MSEVSPGLEGRVRVVVHVAYALLVLHAVFVVATAEWPAAAALALVLVAWYDYRASTTLRRVRRKLFEPTPG